MSKDKLVPKLRFEEFSAVWEKRTLGELGNVAMNKRIFKNQTSEKGEIPFYKIGTFGKEPDAYISRELFDEYKSKYSYPKIGDILISASGSIGRTVEYKGGDEYFQDSNIVWLNHNGKIDNHFLKQFYKIVTWHGLEGSTIKRLYNSNILNTEIILPILEEQEKIGSFFKKLDQMIQLQQSKVNKVKDLKSAYLSEMFPKEGEKYPKKRFEGFTEPWIEYSLERLGDIVGGNSWKSNEYDKEGSHLIITIANVSGDYYVDINEGNKITPNNNRYVLSEGDILISMTGNVGRVSRMPEVKAVLNQRVGKLVINSGIDKEFIFTMLQNKKFERSMILRGQGAAQLNISRTDILDYRFKIPEYNEQKKIGELFKNINDQISVEEEKLTKLEKLKQAYLNDMFV